MVGHVADAVLFIGLLLPGHEDPDSVAGDAGDAVGGHQHDAGTEHNSATEKLQPRRDDNHLVIIIVIIIIIVVDIVIIIP